MRVNLFFIVLLLFIFHSAAYSQSKKIALLYPQNTILLPTENAEWLNDNFYRWELFLIQNQKKYEVIKDTELEEMLSDDYSILILPFAEVLTEKEITAVKDFLNGGNSVLSTGGFAVYEVDGTWKSWNVFEQIFGVSFVSEINQEERSRIHSLLGGTPLSANIPAGFRLQVTTYDKPVEVKINSKNTFPLGYWQNSSIPFEGKKEFEKTTSAVYGSYGKGNFVWLGFEFSAVVGSKVHQKVADDLFKNIINWLEGDLIFQLETWPSAKKCAAVLSCDVEFKFNFINNALELIEKEKIPVQFYILTESIDLPSFERLKNIGDLGLHGDSHILFKWQDYNTQLTRLSAGIETLEKLSGKKPIAFRPPETFFDDITLNAMESADMKILSSDRIEDRAVPQFLDSHPNILVIPKTGFDDFDIFEKLKIGNINAQSERYLLDFKRTYEEGGLYSLNFHTQMQSRSEFVGALIKPIQEIKLRDVWITTHNRVYEWWLKRSKLEFSTKINELGDYSIEVKNKGNESIGDVVLSLHKRNLTDLIPVKITVEGRVIDFEPDFINQKIKFPLPIIYPQETKHIIINFIENE